METIEQAIYATLAYADIFDYPLTASEIHRYLIGWNCTPRAVVRELEQNRSLGGMIAAAGKYYTLPGRENIVATRRQREEISCRLQPKALSYGSWIAALPFVRMVALTGSLSVDNARGDADIDFLIVTQRDRLWTTRAMVILMSRLAARQGAIICPNYFITEDNLVFTDRNLYTAHEIVQMIPIAGLKMYQQLIDLNTWTCEFLPNAQPHYVGSPPPGLYYRAVKPALEAALRLPLASKVERWEMKRKIRRFSKLAASHPEACFRPDLCKGHVDDHGLQTQIAFRERMMAFEEVYR